MKAAIFLLSLLLASPLMAQNFLRADERAYLEVEYRQGQMLGRYSSITGLNMRFPRAGTISLGYMNQDIERTRGGETKSVKNFAYGGGRFSLLRRPTRRTIAELYAVVGVGSMEYRQTEQSGSVYSSGPVVVVQPGLRFYRQTKPMDVGIGVSGISVSAGDGIDGGPYGDIALRVRW